MLVPSPPRLALACLLWTAAGCGRAMQDESPAAAYAEARQKWLERDDLAHRAWLAIDPRSPEGERARERLARADARYRAGLTAFRAGQAAEARQHFVAAAELGPIDPHHYMELARIYSARGMPDAARKYYRKLLRALPDLPEHARIERELAALELDPTAVLEAPRTAAVIDDARGFGAPWLRFLPLPVLALLLLLWADRRRSARKLSLSGVIDNHPELHPTIAYLVGSLRHELLKHRVAAVGEALAGDHPAAEGRDGGPGRSTERALSSAEQAFARARLTGVDAAFREHAAAFTRELGHRVVIERDPLFRRAARAASALERALPALADGRRLPQLRAAHAALLRFDRELALLQKRLVRTRIDAALLRELVLKAYAESDLRSAAIDDLECRAEGLPVLVEVLRSDLLLILRNLLRNAVFAAARGAAPRLVRLQVQVELEPTGQEFVCLAVQDSSAQPLTPEQIAQSGLGSGLGLSAAAVRRYGGSLSVASASAPMRKQVCVRFARVFDDTEPEDRR